MIDGRNFFNQPVRNDLITYNKISKFETDQGDDYTTGCLLDFPYFREYYKKQQALDTDLKAIKQINFTAKSTNRYNKIFHSWRIERDY